MAWVPKSHMNYPNSNLDSIKRPYLKFEMGFQINNLNNEINSSNVITLE